MSDVNVGLQFSYRLRHPNMPLKKKSADDNKNFSSKEHTNPGAGVCIVEHFAKFIFHSIGVDGLIINIQKVLQLVSHHDNIDTWKGIAILCG